MTMIKHVIWDFDGTLFDSYPGMVNAFLRALKKSMELKLSMMRF